MSGELTLAPCTDEDFERLRHQAGDWLQEYFEANDFETMSVRGWNSLCKAMALFADREAQRRLASLSAQEDKL